MEFVQTSRQITPRDWRKKLQYIQSKVAVAAVALPQDQRPSDADTAMDYLEVRDMRDTLAASTSERSLFGGLTGHAGVWDKLVRAYEKERAHCRPHVNLGSFAVLDWWKLCEAVLWWGHAQHAWCQSRRR